MKVAVPRESLSKWSEVRLDVWFKEVPSSRLWNKCRTTTSRVVVEKIYIMHT